MIAGILKIKFMLVLRKQRVVKRNTLDATEVRISGTKELKNLIDTRNTMGTNKEPSKSNTMNRT